MIDLGNGIYLNPDTKMFTKTIDGKILECKSYTGLLNSIDSYMETVEMRESLRDELVPVYKLGVDKEFLYHPLRHHIYVINVHGKLTRVSVDVNRDKFYEDPNTANDINDLKFAADIKLSYYSDKSSQYRSTLREMAVKIKPYNKGK